VRRLAPGRAGAAAVRWVVAGGLGKTWPLMGALGSMLPVRVLLAQGVSHRASAKKLYLTEATIKHHVANILTKLPAENHTRAVAIARRHALG
jgi:regulatory LuxR family protein